VQRILLVEDTEERYTFFQQHLLPGIKLVWAKSAGAALKIIDADEPDTYQGIMLDHDLGDAHADGRTVTLKVVEKTDRDTLILVHTSNVVAGPQMHAMLQHADFAVSYVPFYQLTADRYRAWQQLLPEA